MVKPLQIHTNLIFRFAKDVEHVHTIPQRLAMVMENRAVICHDRKDRVSP